MYVEFKKQRNETFKKISTILYSIDRGLRNAIM